MEKIYRYYAGANTPSGFVNCFKNTVLPNKKSFTFILKGGPGTGKSSLLKRLANTFYSADIAVECFHCSLDSSSLDAVALKDFGIVILDGTAPHVLDVNILGITEKIVNLGAFLDNSILKFENEIKMLTDIKKKCLDLSSDYFNAAFNFYNATKHFRNLDEEKVEVLTTELFKRIPLGFEKSNNESGFERKLFNRTIGDEVGIFEEGFNELNKIEFESDETTAPKVLEQLAKKLSACNKDTVIFLNPLCSDDIEAIFILESKTMIKAKFTKSSEIKTDFNRQMQALAISEGKTYIDKARSAHSKIESYYIDSMNFSLLDECAKKLEEDIFNLIETKAKLN